MLDPTGCPSDVSRETIEKLRAFQDLVRRWSPRINLVSRKDLDCIWTRHIIDSVQLVGISSTPERWIDLGSGGGFPGIVVAIVLQQQGSGCVTLVESDKRKCAFLMTAARSLDLRVDVIASRVEDLKPAGATTISARALAPLENLIGYAHCHLAPEGVAVFPKGQDWKNELQAAKDKWSFDWDMVQSTTDSGAAILKLQNIMRI